MKLESSYLRLLYASIIGRHNHPAFEHLNSSLTLPSPVSDTNTDHRSQIWWHTTVSLGTFLTGSDWAFYLFVVCNKVLLCPVQPGTHNGHQAGLEPWMISCLSFLYATYRRVTTSSWFSLLCMVLRSNEFTPVLSCIGDSPYLPNHFAGPPPYFLRKLSHRTWGLLF